MCVFPFGSESEGQPLEVIYSCDGYFSSIVHGGTGAYHTWGTGAFPYFRILLTSAFLDPV